MFWRDTGEVNKNMYRVYKTVPFLWEMKVITDWIVTPTCLDLF